MCSYNSDHHYHYHGDTEGQGYMTKTSHAQNLPNLFPNLVVILLLQHTSTVSLDYNY